MTDTFKRAFNFFPCHCNALLPVAPRSKIIKVHNGGRKRTVQQAIATPKRLIPWPSCNWFPERLIVIIPTSVASDVVIESSVAFLDEVLVGCCATREEVLAGCVDSRAA